ncbi:MAG: LamG-like jellyroll fold domain-containing protein [Planctomycetota bacterium]
MRRPVCSALGLIACALLVAPVAGAAPFVFYQGADIPELGITNYQGAADLRLNDNFRNGNGGRDDLFVGDAGNEADNRSLLRFDLSALAGYELAGDAALRVRVNQVRANPDATDFFDIHRIAPTNAGWAEGNNGSVTQSASGLEPSWDRYSQSPDQPWRDAAGNPLPGGTSPAGALGQPGEGYEAAPIATINQASYSVGDFITVPIPRDVAQAVVDGDDSGFILRKRDETDSGRLAFDKKEVGNAARRPRLTVHAVLANRPLYSDRVLADDPLLYYRLNETAGPVAVNSGTAGAPGDGSIVGPPALGQDGPQPLSGQDGFEIANTAPDFTGGGRVDVPAGVLPTGNAARTIEGWFQGGDNTQAFFHYGTGSGSDPAGRRVSVTASGDRVAAAVSGHNFGVGGLDLKPGWHHLAVVLPDGATRSNEWEFYVDGVRRTSTQTFAGSPRTVNTRDNPAYVGNDRRNNAYQGLIDELAVYNKALGGTDVFSHHGVAIGMDGVAAAVGEISPIAKPASIAQSQSAANPTTSDSTVFFFQECSNLELASDLPLDITRPGVYGADPDGGGPSGLDGSQGVPGVVPAGTGINSYYLHYDTIASGPTNGGTITFDAMQEILGAAVTLDTLQATDFLGGLSSAQGPRLIPGHQYPDLFTLSDDRRAITFNLLNGGSHVDQIRIITTLVPEPATLSLLALGTLGLLRRKR